MGQQDCLDILKGNGWMSTNQIMACVDIHQSSINESLKRLYKGGFVDRKKDKNTKHGYLYKLKN